MTFVLRISHQSHRKSGADPGEVKWVNFHPPFSEPPLKEPSITFWAVNIVEDISG